MRLVSLLATTAISALIATTAFAQETPTKQTPAERATAPGAPAGTIQDDVNNTTQPPTNPDGTVPTTTTTTVTTQPAAPMESSSASMPEAAMPAAAAGANVSSTEPANVQIVTNGPVPDTAENRAKYGGPQSHAGKRSAAKGN
jgi:hypothetical protein